MLKKKVFGFTLAEVLITLGIIGVVATMTMPTLMLNMRRKTTSARLKKFYSTMKQALLLSEDEHGGVSCWDTSLPYGKFFDTYLLPYLKGTKEGTNDNIIYFSDGSQVELHKGSCMDFVYDVNGNLPPNRGGYDKFSFLACENGHGMCMDGEGFCTYRATGTDKTNRAELLRLCKENSWNCSALLEYDHWEFLPDYPYK